jgi:hypothetical protein
LTLALLKVPPGSYAHHREQETIGSEEAPRGCEPAIKQNNILRAEERGYHYSNWSEKDSVLWGPWKTEAIRTE